MFRGATPPYEPIVYRWPGGEFPGGRVYRGPDRLEIGQWTEVGAPGPWRIGDPAADPLVTLEGSVDLAIPDEANEQWERLEDQHPWLVMVQLDWNRAELHLRAYLSSPPPHLQEASFAAIPSDLRNLMSGRGGAVLGHGLPDLWFEESDLRDPWRTSPDGSASLAPPAPPARPAGLGRAYEPADEQATSAAPEPFDVDPDDRDRATRLHATTQNAVAAAARARGRDPKSPDGEPRYDLAWKEPDDRTVVVEVKSITPRNAERQLRLGLGQVLRYRHILGSQGQTVAALVALGSPPHDDRWIALCRQLDVGLIWMPDVAGQLDDWLDP